MKRSINKEQAADLATQYRLPQPEATVRILRHTQRDRRKLLQLIRRKHDVVTAQAIEDLLNNGWTLHEIQESFDFNIPVSETIAEFLWHAGYASKPSHLTARHEGRPFTSEEKKEKRRRKRGFKRSSRT